MTRPTITTETVNLSSATASTPVGELLLAATPVGLLRLAFDNEDWEAVMSRLMADVHDDPAAGSPVNTGHHLATATQQLGEYFAGERRRFDVPLDLRLIKGFRRAVAEHLLTIPYGSTESYAEVARALDNPNAVRAVGSACANNPIPVLIPCHRVLTSDGRIGGYLGGTSAKEYLLRLEGVTPRRSP